MKLKQTQSALSEFIEFNDIDIEIYEEDFGLEYVYSQKTLNDESPSIKIEEANSWQNINKI